MHQSDWRWPRTRANRTQTLVPDAPVTVRDLPVPVSGAQSNGSFRREYSKGTVVLNPPDAGAAITVDTHGFLLADGDEQLVVPGNRVGGLGPLEAATGRDRDGAHAKP